MAKKTTERLRYGYCINDECALCKSKEIQKVALRDDFVCSECKEELRECPPPKKKNPKPLIIGGVSLLAIAAVVVGIVLALGQKSDEPQVEEPTPVEVTVEEPVVEEPVVEEPVEVTPEPAKPVKVDPKPATPKLDYGTWTGGWKNGKPNGTGTLTYTKQHLIDKRDTKQRMAEPGDYITGEFSEGKLVQGVWYDKNNNSKGGLMLGK